MKMPRINPMFAFASLALFLSSPSDAAHHRGHGTSIQGHYAHLQETTAELHAIFRSHLQRQHRKPTSAEAELLRAIDSLSDDVKHLGLDLSNRCSIYRNHGRNHLYRTFHMVEYSLDDTWTIAAQAGYGRSLNDYFTDMELHVTAMASAGLSNPRIQGVSMRSGARHHRPHQQHSIDHGHHRTQTTSRVSTSTTRSGPPTRSGSSSHGNQPRPQVEPIQLGALLERIFRK
jgi:hypothetical protein